MDLPNPLRARRIAVIATRSLIAVLAIVLVVTGCAQSRAGGAQPVTTGSSTASAVASGTSTAPSPSATLTIVITDWNGWDPNSKPTPKTFAMPAAAGSALTAQTTVGKVTFTVKSLTAQRVVVTSSKRLAPATPSGGSNMNDLTDEFVVTADKPAEMATASLDAGSSVHISLGGTPAGAAPSGSQSATAATLTITSEHWGFGPDGFTRSAGESAAIPAAVGASAAINGISDPLTITVIEVTDTGVRVSMNEPMALDDGEGFGRTNLVQEFVVTAGTPTRLQTPSEDAGTDITLSL